MMSSSYDDTTVLFPVAVFTATSLSALAPTVLLLPHRRAILPEKLLTQMSTVIRLLAVPESKTRRSAPFSYTAPMFLPVSGQVMKTRELPHSGATATTTPSTE